MGPGRATRIEAGSEMMSGGMYDRDVDNPYRAPVGGVAAAKPEVDSEYVGYGGFWRRFAALFIDQIIMGVVGFIVGIPFGIAIVALDGGASGQAGGQPSGAAIAITILSYVVSIAISLGYYCGMTSSKNQATLGKMALGLKVTDLYGQRITFWRALGRELSKVLSGLILGIGYIMAAFDERKQGLHDKIAGTLVLRTR